MLPKQYILTMPRPICASKHKTRPPVEDSWHKKQFSSIPLNQPQHPHSQGNCSKD